MVVKLLKMVWLCCCSIITEKLQETLVFLDLIYSVLNLVRCLNTKLKEGSLQDHLILILEFWHLGNHNLNLCVCKLAER